MNRPRLLRIALLSALLAFAGATAAAENPLAGMSKAFEEHMQKGDMDALSAMYAEDGVILPPNEARIQGRAGIAAWMKGMRDAGFTLRLTPTDEWVDGALAVRSGTFVVVKDGKDVDQGKWLEVWKRGADGKWLMHRDIWNSDTPITPPPTPGVSSDKK